MLRAFHSSQTPKVKGTYFARNRLWFHKSPNNKDVEQKK